MAETSQIRQLQTNVVVNGKSIPVLSWQTHETSYGDLCTFEVKTSTKQLKQSYPTIFQDQDSMSDFECQIYLTNQQQPTIVFDGIIDTIHGTWEEDEIEITGRDYSAIIRDSEQTLQDYSHLTVSQAVQGICDANKITANIQATSQIAGIQVNAFQGIDWSLSTQPRTSWYTLQRLAEEVDYIVYVDRLKTLHFVPAGMGGANHQYYWRPSNQPGQISQDPILTLSIMQQSRRCNNFTLWLHGYDRAGKEAIYIQQNVGDGGRIIHKRRQDINSQNAQAIADGIIDEIQRKNIVLKMVVEGNLNLNVNDTMSVFETESNDLLGLSGRQLYISSLINSFGMAEYGSAEADGFLTHVTCNQLGSSSSPS